MMNCRRGQVTGKHTGAWQPFFQRVSR